MPIRAAVIMVLTFLLGIVPATMLMPFALLLGCSGAYALFVVDDPARALLCLLFVAASVMSGFGYVALFHAAGDAVTPRIARWLGAGVAANVIGICAVTVAVEAKWFTPGDWFLLVAPLAIGCAHLTHFVVRRLPPPSS
jgi:hypothetical protein